MSDGDSGKDLLHQLRIDSAQRDDDGVRGPRWPWIVGAIVVIVIGVAIAMFALRSKAVPVQTVTAVALASAGNDAAV
ncbi:MAG TPA: efflux RND transporter periplasmic adaptor subunit, partial [Rhodanobacteraceae bacterium]|nr:efflux RND transporter periplasmic adaptor subunit [Rhodanobacteraceae bacterium]